MTISFQNKTVKLADCFVLQNNKRLTGLHPPHSIPSGMNKFTVSIFILLLWFKICTSSKIDRKSKAGHLILTKSGKLFLQHPKKTKKDKAFDGNDNQLDLTSGRNSAT